MFVEGVAVDLAQGSEVRRLVLLRLPHDLNHDVVSRDLTLGLGRFGCDRGSNDFGLGLDHDFVFYVYACAGSLERCAC